MHRSTSHSRRHTKAGSRKACLVVALLLLLALCSLIVTSPSANAAASKPVAPPAGSPAGPDPAPRPVQPDVDPDAAAALASKKSIKLAEARAQLARERDLGARGARIAKSLAGRSGGTYLDTNGRLVVTTLDTAADAVATRSHALAKRVDDSSARLNAIVDQLDRQASMGGPGAVQGWYVDVPTNSVVVTVTQGATDSAAAAITRLATGFGDSVRIEHRPADQAPKPAEWLVGGYQYVLPSGGTCSGRVQHGRRLQPQRRADGGTLRGGGRDTQP